MQQLQSVLNYPAHLIFNLKRFDHITLALFDLHWLPYSQHITYKLCMFLLNACMVQSLHLADCCVRTSLVPGRSFFRPAVHCDIVVSSH